MDMSIPMATDSGVSWSCGDSEVLVVAVAGVPQCGDVGGGGVTLAASPQKCQHLCDFPDIADISPEQAASREGGPMETQLITLPKVDSWVLGAGGGFGGSRGSPPR